MVSSGHTYFVTNKKSGTALDLSGEDQTSVIGFTLHRGDNQKWTFVQLQDGWTIQNVFNGKYLDISGNLQDNVKVVAVETSNPKKWDVTRDDIGGGWRIQSKGTRFDLDLTNRGDPTPRTPVALWGRWEGENQVWKVEETAK